MAINVLNWVLDNSPTQNAARHVMIVLAEAANQDGGGAYPSVATIGRRAGGLSRRAVQDNLRRLERQGHIVREGAHGSGTNIYGVVGPFNAEDVGGAASRSGGADSAPPGGRTLRQEGAQIPTGGGAAGRTPGAHVAAPEPTSEPIPEPTEDPHTPRAREEIPPVLAPVVACLRRVVEAKGAKPLNVAAVIKACRDFPDREHVDLAEEFESYWIRGGGENVERSDIAATWRKRLRSAPTRSAAKRRLNGQPANRGATSSPTKFGDARVGLRWARSNLPDLSEDDQSRAVNVLRELEAADLPITAENVLKRLPATGDQHTERRAA